MGELNKKEAKRHGAIDELAGVQGRMEAVGSNTFSIIEFIREFAYYMAYVDAIHAAKK
ncbi:hypothetical protein OROGR_003653 [Orobanche gracilis]